MSDNLKFRAWDKKAKLFRYFFGIFNDRPYIEMSSFPQYESLKKYIDLEDAERFTGVKDNCGVYIYENDIVTSGMLHSDVWVPCNAVIKWDNSYAQFIAELVDQEIGDNQLLDVPCKIIGNVHEGIIRE